MIRSKRKRKTRVGKTGTVRLGKKDLASTRQQVFFQAKGECQMRDKLVAEIVASDLSEYHKAVAISRVNSRCWRWVSEAHGHDAHIRTKRNHGDAPSNRLWSCPPCHVEGDHNAFGKPCPPKPQAEASA